MNNYLSELIKRGKELDKYAKANKDANSEELYLIREILRPYGLNEQSEVGVDFLVVQNLPSQNDLLTEIIKLREYAAKHINIFGGSPIERIYDKLFELEQKFSKQTA